MYALCRHIMPSGARCGSPALRGQDFCYYHRHFRLTAIRNRSIYEPLRLPSLDDPRGVQIAIAEVLEALANSRIDPRHAGLYLYGIQIAAQVAARPAPPLTRGQIVEEVCPQDNGEDLAPQDTRCDPGPDECAGCTRSPCLEPSKRCLNESERKPKDEFHWSPPLPPEPDDQGVYKCCFSVSTQPDPSGS